MPIFPNNIALTLSENLLQNNYSDFYARCQSRCFFQIQDCNVHKENKKFFISLAFSVLSP